MDEIAYYQNALQESDLHTRHRILVKVANAESAVAIPVLTVALKDSDYGIRRHATSILIKIGVDAVPVFIEALNDSDEELRVLSVRALLRIGDAHAVPALITVLKDAKLSPYAAEALFRIGHAAVPALTELLQDEDDRVRSYAKYALFRMGEMELILKCLQ